MKINSYYRQDSVPQGVDPNIFEKKLGAWIETIAKGAIDRLIHNPSELDDNDTATLLTYIELQRIRVPRQATMAKQIMRSAILRILPPDAASSVRAGEVVLSIKDSMRFTYMAVSIGLLNPWLGCMEWEIIAAEKGSAFITTDSPVSFFHEKFLPPSEPGLALAGTIVLFPLSSKHLLLMRHPEYSGTEPISALTLLPEPPDEDGSISITHGIVWTTNMVTSVNWKLLQLADHLIVGESREVLEQCLAA